MDPVRQAQALAQVKYQPTLSTLAQLLAEAHATLNQGVHDQGSAAHMILNQVNQSAPALVNAYSQAGGKVDQTNQEVGGVLGSLGPAADAFRAAIGRDVVDTHGSLAQALAGGQSDLQDEKMKALDTNAWNVGQLQHAYQASAAQIAQKLLDTAQAQGTYTAAEASALKTAAAQAAAAVANDAANRATRLAVAGVTPSGAYLPGRTPASLLPKGPGAGKKPGSGLGSLTQAQSNTAEGQLGEAVQWAQNLSKTMPADRVKQTLTTGAPAGAFGTSVSKQNGSTVKVQSPAVPAFKNQAIVNAAADIAALGHVTPQTQNQLHAAGIHIPSQWRQPHSAAGQVNAGGQAVGGFIKSLFG